MSKARKTAQSPEVTARISEQFRINAAFESRQEEVLELLADRRKKDAQALSLLERANLAFARAEEDLAHIYQRKTYEITSDLEWEAASIDPRVGVKTEGWSEIVIEHLVSEDAEWLAAKKTYYDAQELASKARQDTMAIQAEVTSLHDEIGALKNRALYRAALLFASVPISIDLVGAGDDQLPEGLSTRIVGKKGIDI